jgi:hypothetical protein
MSAPITTTRMYVAGRLVEYWEDPDVLFDWTRDALQRYADARRWVVLFNGLVLGAAAVAAAPDS